MTKIIQITQYEESLAQTKSKSFAVRIWQAVFLNIHSDKIFQLQTNLVLANNNISNLILKVK